MSQNIQINLNQRTMPFLQDQDPKVFSTERLPGEVPSFDALLQESLVKVNTLHKTADRETQRLALGDVEDISQVVTAVSQAELALKLVVEIRNKLVDAYQEIARMSV